MQFVIMINPLDLEDFLKGNPVILRYNKDEYDGPTISIVLNEKPEFKRKVWAGKGGTFIAVKKVKVRQTK